MPPPQPPPQPIAPLPPTLPPRKRRVGFLIAAVALVVLAVAAFVFISVRSSGGGSGSNVQNMEYASSTGAVQYLAFQLFTDTTGSKALQENFPPMQKDVKIVVNDIVRAIGTVGSSNKKLGFIVGPISFDMSDDEVRQRISDSFAIALQDNVAVGLHIDDSMFWGRLSNLNSTENIEWLDWNKTPNTGRRLDWSATPTKLMPQLCLNSPAVEQAVKDRAALIGEEIVRGHASLKAVGKEDLFIGVIAGWETQMGRDFATGKYLGYCALTNLGYSAKNPPADIDQARADIVKDFIDLWTAYLAAAGVPDEKIYSHSAFMSKTNFDSQHLSGTYMQTVNFTPPSVAFGEHHHPGFSTYPESGHPEQIQAELAKNGNPAWASAEGTALDPAQAEGGGAGDAMEAYLANMFNHGAALVNVFGWGVGQSGNPFREVAENNDAIAAYKKFLGGTALSETATTPNSSGGSLQDKVHTIQNNTVAWAKAHPDQKAALYAQSKLLDQYIQANDLKSANKTADAILQMMGL
ncbi:MAG: hypothetical protein Q7S26_01250 [bacterium]|nr:hypothetical protein [bacterium]